eukprot:CAMPEP_0171465834 /NCGR_PEP_ID=MMETSP0945-20130129/8802_1 /TAXON_ID=109269 /ORGANISM="Vaucheria litorea, Strain CCMP2940" /LENGTH=70 /DNA_ID=CAMNT_0011993617 /DNA_START=271 /DNA_END=480 /DNA_ORIENTATION=-
MSTADNSSAQGQPCANQECNFTGHAGFDNYCSVCYKSQMNKSPKPVAEKEQVKMEVDEKVAPKTEETVAP